MNKINIFPIKTVNIAELDDELSKICEVIHNKSVTQSKPTIVHMLGIPGSGKSTIAEFIYKQISSNNTNISLIAFDKIMNAIGAYKNDRDVIKAFEKHEIPARNAGYSLLKSLIDKKAHILFDHGGADNNHPYILEYAKSKGYLVYILYITTSIEIAKDRIIARQKTDGRFTPLEYVDKRHVYINKLLPIYKTIADNFFDISNDKEQNLIDFKTNHVNNIIVNIFK